MNHVLGLMSYHTVAAARRTGKSSRWHDVQLMNWRWSLPIRKPVVRVNGSNLLSILLNRMPDNYEPRKRLINECLSWLGIVND